MCAYKYVPVCIYTVCVRACVRARARVYVYVCVCVCVCVCEGRGGEGEGGRAAPSQSDYFLISVVVRPCAQEEAEAGSGWGQSVCVDMRAVWPGGGCRGMSDDGWSKMAPAKPRTQRPTGPNLELTDMDRDHSAHRKTKYWK